MSVQLSEAQLSKLLSELPVLADVIAKDGDADATLTTILDKTDSEIDKRNTKEFLSHIVKTLKECQINKDTDEAAYVAKLRDFMIPQASAELAIARARGKFVVDRTDEQKSSLLSLASVIAENGDTSKAIDDILAKSMVVDKDHIKEELNNYLKVLLECHINLDHNEQEFMERLVALGVPESSAKLAINMIREEVLTDIEFEKEHHNYVRAVLLAQKHHCSTDSIRNLQELAIRQYASEYRNLPGLRNLIRDWEIPKDQVESILLSILEEQHSYALSEDSLRYDIYTSKHINLKDWIVNAKTSLFSGN